MRGKKAEIILLQKIISYCDEIYAILKNGDIDRGKFEESHTIQLACGMCIIQIGELISRLDDGLIEEHPEIEWRKIKGMRNLYAHDYDAIDNNMVWETLEKKIPELKLGIQEILNATPDIK